MHASIYQTQIVTLSKVKRNSFILEKVENLTLKTSTRDRTNPDKRETILSSPTDLTVSFPRAGIFLPDHPTNQITLI